MDNLESSKAEDTRQENSLWEEWELEDEEEHPTINKTLIVLQKELRKSLHSPRWK